MDENNTKNETSNTTSTDTEKELTASALTADSSKNTSDAVTKDSAKVESAFMPDKGTDAAPATPANYYSSTGSAPDTGNTTAPNVDPTAGSNSDFYTTSYAPAGEPVPTGFAIASLVMGILSILGCCCYGLAGIIFGILGIIFGCIQQKAEYGKKPGMAIAGIITSAVGLILGIIVILCFVLFAGAGALESL